MKILFILENHYPNIGGVETLFKYLTESLAAKGHTITVLTNQFDKKLERRMHLNGVDIVRVPFRNRYLFTLLAFFPAVRLARKHDVIHTTSYNAGIPAYFGGLFTRKKVLITFHEVWGNLWFRLPFMSKFSLMLHYIFEKFLLVLPFHRFIAVSEATASSLQTNGIKKEKIITIHNGIDYSEYLSTSVSREAKEKFRFIYFGRLGISKGLDILLSGLELLNKDFSNFRMTLVIPTQPEKFHKQIREIISDKNLEEIIDIKSDLEKEVLMNEIRNSDTVIIPSYSEGFCFTAVETMALKVPIISSGKGALSEVVSGRHLTMKSHDALGLKDAMVKAIANEWSESPLKEFPLENSIQEYMDMYAKLDRIDKRYSTT